MKIINYTGKKILICASKGPSEAIKKTLDNGEEFEYTDAELGAIYLHDLKDGDL